ncbi:MAG: hypothetical protein PHE84_07895 [bacterium]|nr:hypothetical protein [bacterium]
MKRINLALSLIVAFWLGSCGSADSPSQGTGGVTFDLVWQDGGPVLTVSDPGLFAFAPARFYPQALPAAVVSLRATVTGPDMEQLEQTFSGLYPAGGTIVVRSVQAGDNRKLVLDGLNSANAIIYQGTIDGFTVVAEQTNDIGQIVMGPYGEGIVAPPSNLQAQAVSSSQLALSWTDNANNETGFYIERRRAIDNVFSSAGSVGRDVTVFQDENLSCGMVYSYRVFAYGAVESSDYSNEFSIFLPCLETVITMVPASPTRSPDPLFGFYCNFASCSFECDLDGGGYSICTSPRGYSGVADGQHLFSVRAVDISGRVDSSPATFSWKVDRVPPETEIVQTPDSPSDAEVGFGFACNEGNCTYECNLDSAGFSVCPVPSVFRLANGVHILSVRAVDQAGNVDASPADYSWLVIALPPGLPGEERAPAPIGSWQKTRSKTVPEGRYAHTTVWTGTKMIVWGGTSDGGSTSLNSGGLYDPATDTWEPTSLDGYVPEPRGLHTAVWTGEEMIIWGGNSGGEGGALGTGGRYNPATDTWTPTITPTELPEGREYASLVWTGTEAIAWGGDDYGYFLQSGCRYDPSTDMWTATAIDANTPSVREYHTAVWTGTEMIIWGGYDGSYLNTGGRYNPSSDSWLPTSTGTNVPYGRQDHTAVWTGTEMIVWGGNYYDGGTWPYYFYLNDGGRYDPSADSWTTTDPGAPSGRSKHTAVWTGSEMIVWGGESCDYMAIYSYYNDGARYNPTTDVWTSTLADGSQPSTRSQHTAVWDSTDGWMIVWGGWDGAAYLQDGSRYDPSADSWMSTALDANTPSGRQQHTAVWTGTEMIVWGGNDGGGLANTGGRYNPSGDAWTPTSTGQDVPTPRYGQAMVWTGKDMIVWSGYDGSYTNAGSAYDPSLDIWWPIGNGPFVEQTPRYAHSAVWTGKEMIVWGGYDDSYYLNTGARYNPGSDSWTPTSVDGDVPSGRDFHQAVWTGAEMIVWGGTDSYSYFDTGGRYDPETDSWKATQPPQVPSRRMAATSVWTGTEMIVWGGIDDSGYLNTGGRYNPSIDAWTATDSSESAPQARQQHTAVWTGTEMIVWGGYNYQNLDTGGRYNPSTDSWISTSTATGVPAARADHTAVWDNNDGLMVVWGGNYHFGVTNTGGRYNPNTDTWTPTSTDANVPSSRYGHAAVWTGSKMIVWGGTNGELPIDGGVYDPYNDTWTPIAQDANTPSGRYYHTAVWTGTEMIVWGGYNGSYLNDGGRYNPSSDSWTAIAVDGNTPSGRQDHTAVWTGTEMIVWGGTYHAGMTMFNDGGKYNPSDDTWTPTNVDVDVPSGRYSHTAVWTGNEMLVWGGFVDYSMGSSYTNTGGRYNPADDTWTPMATSVVPSGRTDFTAVWTGSEMIVWGGHYYDGGTYPYDFYLNDGGRYNPFTDTWTLTGTGENVPSVRGYHSAVWTGTEMIVWGGYYYENMGEGGNEYCYNDGGRYDPADDSWTPVSVENAPSERDYHSAVWTGTEMIVWGGEDVGSNLIDGGRYNPAQDSWTATDTGATIPSGREYHTAVWTGTEMIVWGGMDMNNNFLNDGGRYDPATDSWTPIMIDAYTPSGRYFHTAVWTGTKMIIWGGYDWSESLVNDGGQYDPAGDSWTPVTIGANTPSGRQDHTVVWTGAEMIVWGGLDQTSYPVNDGGRYDPVTDSWMPTAVDLNTPSGRHYHTAVWTGTEMIVWGGLDQTYYYANDGGRYDPALDSWEPISTTDAPTGRENHSVVWTGYQMIVWGGDDGYNYFNDGGLYDPDQDTWKPVTTKFAPSGRSNHTAIWAFGAMIVWGGMDDSYYYRSGGIYDPSGDTWVGTVLTGAPSGRVFHTAVWTGNEMIIWGGYNFLAFKGAGNYMDTGGRFSFQTGDTSGEAFELPFESGGGEVIVP